MRPRSPLRVVILMPATLIAWHVLAAPILPTSRQLPDEVLSLAGIDAAQFLLVRDATALEDNRFEFDDVEKRLRTRLRDGGLDIVESSAVPTLKIDIIPHAEPRHTDMLGYTCHLSLEQEVLLTRLSQARRVPTYAIVHGGFALKEEANKAIEDVLEILVDQFLARKRVATELQAQGGDAR